MTRTTTRYPFVWLTVAAISLVSSGCGTRIETSYGTSRSTSVNGTSVLAGLFRARGHEVRVASRLTEELNEWANVIVRFSQTPGPPPKDEADWYMNWLHDEPGRRLIYVPRDYDATAEYWQHALDQLPANATERTRERIREAKAEVVGWENDLPTPAKTPAPAQLWFTVETPGVSAICKKLSGPWAVGIDPAKVALTRHQTLKTDHKDVLLSGDDKPLVVEWVAGDEGGVLVLANATFLLNVPLTEPARWPLAERVMSWAEADEPIHGSPLRVAFVERRNVTADPAGPPSIFDLLWVAPFGRVSTQLLVLGLAACLARAPRLGRARPEPTSDAERPVAHPEAIGWLLAKTRQAGSARSILEQYRRWRTHGTGQGGGTPPREPSSQQ